MGITENKKVFYLFYNRAWNLGDATVVDELLAPNFVNHEIEGMTTQSHRELYKQGIIETYRAFPDWTTTFDGIIAELDKVILQWQAQGTHTGEGMGEPSGKQLRYEGISIARIVEGKITEFWKKDNSYVVWQQHIADSLNYFDKLLHTTDGYNKKYPKGNAPFQIITRLCEEAGELASVVNHFEDTGIKRHKHGLPDKAALAKEVQDVIRTALSITRYYKIEQELKDSIDQSYQTKVVEGYIVADNEEM